MRARNGRDHAPVRGQRSHEAKPSPLVLLFPLLLWACSSAPPKVTEGPAPKGDQGPSAAQFLSFETPACQALYKRSSDYVFVEIPRDESPKVRWRALEQGESVGSTRSSKKAGITRLDGWILVSLSSAGGGGEWIKFEDYCFDPESHLHELHTRHTSYARQCEKLGTLHESVQRFDSTGKRVGLKNEWRELKTSQLLSCDDEIPLPEYLNYGEVPFSGASDDNTWYDD